MDRSVGTYQQVQTLRHTTRALLVAVLALLVVLSASGCTLFRYSLGDETAKSILTRLDKVDERIDQILSSQTIRSGFPWSLFLGLLSMTGVAVVACFLFAPLKALAGIVAAGGIGIACVLVLEAYKWQILIGVLVVVALTFGVLFLRRSKYFRDLVGTIEEARVEDPEFKAAFTKKVKGKLGTSTEKAIKAVK